MKFGEDAAFPLEIDGALLGKIDLGNEVFVLLAGQVDLRLTSIPRQAK